MPIRTKCKYIRPTLLCVFIITLFTLITFRSPSDFLEIRDSFRQSISANSSACAGAGNSKTHGSLDGISAQRYNPAKLVQQLEEEQKTNNKNPRTIFKKSPITKTDLPFQSSSILDIYQVHQLRLRYQPTQTCRRFARVASIGSLLWLTSVVLLISLTK